MEACTHEVRYSGICATCGSLIEDDDPQSEVIGNINVKIGYDTVGLTVSRQETERLEAENARRLLRDHKLSLILDLDQTVVHASWDKRVGEWKKEGDDIRQFTLPKDDTMYYIKLRPGLTRFLEQLASLYELHIYTMGTKNYAEAVAKEMDPDGLFFKKKILSRDESGSVTQKKLQRLFPCDTSMVVVLDDRSDVWCFAPNFVRIKPYEYFYGSSVGVTVADEKKDHHDDKEDKELDIMLKILIDVHREFYAQDPLDKETDVTHIIPRMKSTILKNVIISFTDVIPNSVKDPTLSWIWQMATSFGALCTLDLTGKTTHLIAIRNNHKVKAAKEYGHSIHIVTPAWLLDSTARWSIQDENEYTLPEGDSNLMHELLDESAEEDKLEEEDEEEEVIENIDWDEANQEVEDFINESGIDDIWDTATTTTDSEITSASASTTGSRKTRKRKRQQQQQSFESGGESGGDNSEDDNTNKRVFHRQKWLKRGKSRLSQVTTAPSSQCTSGNNSDNDDDDDLSSLDDFVRNLDKAID